ncbi:MAG: SDR family oxidoreductase [Actinomycetota bacterium]|nr:SDR family oxidoreductase [Actinomycetota bacterium]MED5232869.1 SDR family oxidoreductase [Actinomycetota bacterium]MED5393489.1 SDR family oxidoreductase [Actinomycetota bacterium]MEE3354371.1 SDR family oxidoreductase [Actinomycetota bacterium]
MEPGRGPGSATGIDDIGSAVRAAAGLLGTPDLVVHVPALPEGPATITHQSTEAWAASCEAPMAEAIGVARSIGELMATSAKEQAESAPRLVWILPTTALGGAAGYVGVGAAGEGIRALAKGVAKQWGRRCTTTVLAVSPIMLFDGVGPAEEGSLSPPALGRPEDNVIHVMTEIASLVDLLADPRNRATTGATVVADGGTWMAP